MATRAETKRAEDQRRGMKPKAKRRLERKKPAVERHAKHPKTRVEAQATYAREEQAPGSKHRASRKSSRASANRAKPDSNLVLRAARAKGSPESRYRKGRAKAARVRGERAA